MTDEHRTITAVVGIGRNIGERPMAREVWSRFRRQVEGALYNLGFTVYFAGVGEGVFEGNEEQSATFVAGGSLADVPRLRLSLHTLARSFGQESIALTVGETEFVGGS